MGEVQADNGNNRHTSRVSGLAGPCYLGKEEEEGEEEGEENDLHVRELALHD